MAKLLYIEDESHIREDVVEELEDAGYVVFQARDGMEGLEMIFKHKPDLVLCDINMPRKNGYQVMKELREKYPVFADMPFIFVTALADRERVLAGLRDGADGYLTKPIDFELLQATVKASLRQMNRIKQKNSGLNPGSENDSAETADVKPEDPIDTLKEIVQKAVDSTQAFNASLEQAGAGLSGNSDPEQARTILASLAKAIKDKEQGNLVLKKCIAQTNRQVGNLPMSMENGVQGVSSEFPGQIEIIQEIIQSSEDAMSHFGLTIEQVLPRLSEVSGPGQIEALVEAIDKTINEQRHGNLDLNSRLLQISRQVEHLKEELAIARRESLTDDLTELPNRKCFDQTIIQMIADAKMSNNSLCVLMIDIDHFKQFNDKYGHQSGDAVLKLVAATMKNSVKGCDHVARYGGEEFIAILPETDLKIAEKVANRIRESVSRQELIHHSTGQSRGYVTLSIGIGMLNVDDSIHSLIKRADACLYEAKNAGRNCVLGETCLSGDNTESGAHAA